MCKIIHIYGGMLSRTAVARTICHTKELLMSRAVGLSRHVASVYPSMPSSSAFSILIISSIRRIVMAASVANCSAENRLQDTVSCQQTNKSC